MDFSIKLPSSHSFLTLIYPLLLHLTIFLVLCFQTNAKVELPQNVAVPALVVFGDSIMDTGNNNFKRTITRCNFKPYGKDFPGEVATGRFTNGKAPSDIIAEELGIKEFLPPYLDSKLNATELATGVCFASGGSGYDHVTSKLLNAIPLPDQLDSFKEYIGKLKSTFGEDRTKEILGNSIFLVVFGSNDISNTYFLTRIRKIKYPKFSDYADRLVSVASDFTKEIHQLGARKIGIFNVPPLGCVPLQRTVAGGKERKCVEEYNNATMLFNDKLSNEINSLKTNLSDNNIVYMDVYNPILDAIVNGEKYGFGNVDTGCCGTGKLEVGFLCNRFGSVCSNSSDHVFWDSFHPTEMFFKTFVPPLLKKYINQFF